MATRRFKSATMKFGVPLSVPGSRYVELCYGKHGEGYSHTPPRHSDLELVLMNESRQLWYTPGRYEDGHAYGDRYHCNTRWVSEEARDGVHSGTASISRIEDGIFVREGESESFSDIELARRWFATDWDVFAESAASRFFATIDPIRYGLDMSESTALRLMLDNAQAHPWIADGTATHAFATLAFAQPEYALLWYLVVGPGEYHMRTWRLTSEQLSEIYGWREDYMTRLAGEAPPQPPKFERLADRQLVVRDAKHAIKFFRSRGEEKARCKIELPRERHVPPALA